MASSLHRRRVIMTASQLAEQQRKRDEYTTPARPAPTAPSSFPATGPIKYFKLSPLDMFNEFLSGLGKDYEELHLPPLPPLLIGGYVGKEFLFLTVEQWRMAFIELYTPPKSCDPFFSPDGFSVLLHCNTINHLTGELQASPGLVRFEGRCPIVTEHDRHQAVFEYEQELLAEANGGRPVKKQRSPCSKSPYDFLPFGTGRLIAEETSDAFELHDVSVWEQKWPLTEAAVAADRWWTSPPPPLPATATAALVAERDRYMSFQYHQWMVAHAESRGFAGWARRQRAVEQSKKCFVQVKPPAGLLKAAQAAVGM